MEKLTVNKDGIDKLLDCMMYRIFVVYGRDVELDKVFKIMEQDNIDIPQDMIKGSYEFTQDQYDFNEKDGWNEQEYPNRNKERIS